MALTHAIFDELDLEVDGLSIAQSAQFEAAFIEEFGDDYNINGSVKRVIIWILNWLREESMP